MSRDPVDQIRDIIDANNDCDTLSKIAAVLGYDEADEQQRRRDEADARRFRFLACDGVPQHSVRWLRWRLERFSGVSGWNPLRGDDLRSLIDADAKADRAMGGE